MTESEWWTATDPLALDWLFFDALATDRKLRLFSAACCHSFFPHLRQFATRIDALLSVVEGFADGQVPVAELLRVRDELARVWRDYESEGRYGGSLADDEETVWCVTFCGMPATVHTMRHAEERDSPVSQYRERAFYRNPWPFDPRPFPVAAAIEAVAAVEDETQAKAHQVRLLHDIFGPLPFRDIVPNAAWRTTDVLLLARGIYDEKAFDRMSILADALQDAGCDNTDILSHCRAEGWEHVRGCWAIDLLLGRPWRES